MPELLYVYGFYIVSLFLLVILIVQIRKKNRLQKEHEDYLQKLIKSTNQYLKQADSFMSIKYEEYQKKINEQHEQIESLLHKNLTRFQTSFDAQVEISSQLNNFNIEYQKQIASLKKKDSMIIQRDKKIQKLQQIIKGLENENY